MMCRSNSINKQGDNNNSIRSSYQRENNDKISEDPEQEQWEIRLASVLFAVVGVGYLFPFSALTQPVDYWNELFPDFNIEFLLTSVYMYSNLAMLAVLVVFGGEPSFTPRIVGGFIGQLLVLVFVPTSYFFITSERTNELAVLSATAVVAVFTSFLDSSLIGLANRYPLRVQESFQIGVGISTLIGSIYRDATKLVFPPQDVVESSLLYFYTGAFTILLCLFAYYWLMKLQITKECLVLSEAEEAIEAEKWHDAASTLESQPLINRDDDNNNDAPPVAAATATNKWVVFSKIWFNGLMVTLLFTSTLALWPPLVTEIKSFDFPRLGDSGWWPLVLLTLFSSMDCMGRFLVGFRCGITRFNIWIPILLRFVFFPLIIGCVKGVVFVHDFWSVLFVLGLGFTNGYLGSLTIILTNECIEPEERAIAGMFTSFFLNSGLVLGASAGLLMQRLVVGD